MKRRDKGGTSREPGKKCGSREDRSDESRPLKLWKAPADAACFDQADLLIAADCSAYVCGGCYRRTAGGKIPLICCPETDFDISTKLQKIISAHAVRSVTVLKMDQSCCGDLEQRVLSAVKICGSHIPVRTVCLSPEEEKEL